MVLGQIRKEKKMQIVFIVSTDNSNVDKPEMYTVFENWNGVKRHMKYLGFDEITELDLFDDVISCEGLKFFRETEKGHTISIVVKIGTYRKE